MAEWSNVKVSEIEGLRPLQVECLRFLKWREGRALIGDVPGFGKTVEALSWIRENPQSAPAVIISTDMTKWQWWKEWGKWVPGRKVEVLQGMRPRRLHRDHSYIVNWSILADWADELLGFRTVIADECHKAANPGAARTQALEYIADAVPYFLPMSGTPITRQPGQFFSILHLLEPRRFPSRSEFQNKYCSMVKNRFSGKMEEGLGGKNLNDLNRDLSVIMIRRERREGPQVQRIPVLIEMENFQAFVRKQNEIYARLPMNQRAALAKLEDLGRTAFVHKLPGMLKWIRDFLESGEKLLVFAHHKAAIESVFLQFHSTAVKIDGSVKERDKEEAKRKFIEDPNCTMLIGQLDCLSEAVDGLQRACHNCAFIEFGKTALINEQAWCRLDRSGQEHPVNAYFMIGRNAQIDEHRMSILDRQVRTFNRAVRGRGTEHDELLLNLYDKIKGNHDNE